MTLKEIAEIIKKSLIQMYVYMNVDIDQRHPDLNALYDCFSILDKEFKEKGLKEIKDLLERMPKALPLFDSKLFETTVDNELNEVLKRFREEKEQFKLAFDAYIPDVPAELKTKNAWQIICMEDGLYVPEVEETILHYKLQIKNKCSGECKETDLRLFSKPSEKIKEYLRDLKFLQGFFDESPQHISDFEVTNRVTAEARQTNVAVDNYVKKVLPVIGVIIKTPLRQMLVSQGDTQKREKKVQVLKDFFVLYKFREELAMAVRQLNAYIGNPDVDMDSFQSAKERLNKIKGGSSHVTANGFINDAILLFEHFLTKKLEDYTSTSEEELESKSDSESYDDSSELSPRACFETWRVNIEKLEALRTLNSANTPSTPRGTKTPRLRSSSVSAEPTNSTPRGTKSAGSELSNADVVKASAAPQPVSSSSPSTPRKILTAITDFFSPNKSVVQAEAGQGSQAGITDLVPQEAGTGAHNKLNTSQQAGSPRREKPSVVITKAVVPPINLSNLGAINGGEVPVQSGAAKTGEYIPGLKLI